MVISNRLIPPDISLVMRGNLLSRVSSAKFLGIVLDDKVNFREHIPSLSSKLSRSIGAMYRIRSMIPENILYTLYYTLVYSHLTYALIVWGDSGRGNSDIISKVQRKAFKLFSDNVDEVCREYKFLRYDLSLIHI